MKQVEVFDGNQLYYAPVRYQTNQAKCAFIGNGPEGKDIYVPLDEELMGRHMMFLGVSVQEKPTHFSRL